MTTQKVCNPTRWRMNVAFLALCGLALAGSEARANTLTWSGGSGNWSDPTQWSPNGVPQNGDYLIFNNSPGALLTNDIAGLSVRTLTFNHTAGILGNPLTVTLGIQAFPAESGPLALNFSTLQLGHDITLEANDGTGWGCTLNCSVVLNGFNLTVSSFNSASTAFQGSVLGPGNLIFAFGNNYVSVVHGAGVTVPVRVTGGTLFLDSVTAAPLSSSLELDGGATVSLLDNNQIGSSSTVVINGGSQLLLNSYSSTIGNLVLTNFSGDSLPSTVDTGGGALGLNGGVTSWNDNQSVIPTVKGNINLNGVLPFNIGGSVYAGLDILAIVGSSGGISKNGAAALLLEANNTFSSDTFVLQGIVDVRNNGALGASANNTLLLGGTLALHNASIGGHTLMAEGQSIAADMPGSLLTCVGACSWSGSVQLFSNLVVAGDITLSGAISGQGGIGFFGGGTSLLGGAAGNLYTGTTLVRCPLLEFGKPSGVNAYAGPLVVGGGSGGPYEARWLSPYQNVGATLTLFGNGIVNLNNQNEDFGSVTFNGGEVDTGTGQFAIYQPLTVNPASTTAVINGYLGLPPGDNRVFNVGLGTAGCDLLINAVIFGNAPFFVKQGPGTMCLTAANTFAGATLLEQGILDMSVGSGGLSTTTCVIFDGATLRLEGSGVLPNNLEIVGAGVGGTHGALEVTAGGNSTLNGNILLDTNTVFNVAPSAILQLLDAISGTGPLVKSGAGSLILGGPANNTYIGDTVVSAGSLFLQKVAAAPGNLVVGPASASLPATAVFQVSGGMAGSVATVNGNSLLNLNGKVQTLSQLNLNDGGSVQTSSGSVDFVGGGSINVGSLSPFPNGSHVSSSIQGNLGLPANDVAVNFNINPYAIFYPFDSRPELDVPANIWVDSIEDPRLVPTGIVKNGLGRMRLGGSDSFKGRTLVNAGKLQVDGTLVGYPVVDGGILKGTGTVGPVFLNDSTAVIAPGDSPGILTCSNFDHGGGSGRLQVELDGTTPGSGYSQLNVLGTVNLNGVSLSPTLNYASSVGDQFVILNNDGTDPITGTFTGLPQNATLYIGGQLFQINYSGGTGNDVVLTRLVTPPLPVLTLQSLPTNSVRLLWQTNDPAFVLQFITDLATNNWAQVTNSPIVIGTNNVVTISTAAPQKFYRLARPGF